METPKSASQQAKFLIGLNAEQLDKLPWAITKVNREGIFTYGNRAMSEIVGVEKVNGMTLEDVFHGDDLAKVRKRLESRFTGGGADDYKVTAIRPGDGVRVPTRCSAMPEIDDRGEVIGSIAIIRDLLAEDFSAKVHKAVAELRDSGKILQALAMESARVVAFDMFGVTLFSEDGEHARTLYLYPEGKFQPSVRWHEMSRYAKALVNENEVVAISDYEEWLSRPEWRQYRDDQDTKQMLERGLRSSLSIPVRRGNRVVAMVGFGRMRDKEPFGKQMEEQLDRLRPPLEAAVSMALHYQEVDELKFALKLITKVASGPESPEFIAETLIEEIAGHYEWENVSIFSPHEKERELHLVKQKAQKESFLLRDDWWHSIDKGITGRVYQSCRTLIVPDVDAPEWKDVYIRGYAESRSELCIPILVDGRAYWILNIEDSKINAFAKEEQEALENILREVVVVLKLVFKTQVFDELLKLSKDSVIQTDFNGTIIQTNLATKDLLGHTEAEMKGTAFTSYLKDKDLARRVHEANYVPNEEAHLVCKDGSEVAVLLSGTSLPRHNGLKIYICNDLSRYKRMELLEILRQMYNEIASQIKTPLSLAFTWLSRLKETESQPRASELVDKTIKQLHKVDLTFDRLLFYERHKSIAPVNFSLFEIPTLVERIKQEMPDSESNQIEVTAGPNVPPVRGDLFQIWFCLASLLAYFLRFVPEVGKVAVDIAARQGKVVVIVGGRAPRVTGGALTDYVETRWAIRAITEMALGEQMIRNFIELNHAGEFHKRSGDGDLIEYVIVLPSASAECAS